MIDEQWKELLLVDAAQNNILPLTSTCNVSCIFCSHKQNPPDLKVLKMPPLKIETVKALLKEINPFSPIIIGESVTRIMEGECFTHPKIKEILKILRQRFPSTKIQITTNGSLLDKEMVEFLKDLGDISINLSLNTASIKNRQFLMKDNLSEQAINSPFLLQKYKIDYHGSIVAMPHLLGWDDLKNIILFFQKFNAKTVRIFSPGYTRYALDIFKDCLRIEERLFDFVNGLRKNISLPITIEPLKLTDLKPWVVGVIKDSSAFKAKIKAGDLILEIGGQKPLSRVDAFNILYQSGNVFLKIFQDEVEKEVFLQKNSGESSGVVMDFDVEPILFTKIKRKFKKYSKVKILWLCSELGEKVLKVGANKFLKNFDLTIKSVKNYYFGGSIACAGLLTVEDILKTLKEVKILPSAIILPRMAFDVLGNDIRGDNFKKIESYCQEKNILWEIV